MDEDSLRSRLALNKSVLSTTDSVKSYLYERFDNDERAERLYKRCAHFALLPFHPAAALAGNNIAYQAKCALPCWVISLESCQARPQNFYGCESPCMARQQAGAALAGRAMMCCGPGACATSLWPRMAAR